MTTKAGSNLEIGFAGVSDNFRGAVDDPHPLYTRMRRESPIYVGNLMAELGVPSIAGVDTARPCFTLFKHKHVMQVLRDANNFTSGFISEGLGAFFDGLIITGMDGDTHRQARALLTPIFTASAITAWSAENIEPVVRKEFAVPLAQRVSKRCDLIADFGLHFPVRVIYSLIGFPEDRPEDIQQFAAWALAIVAGPSLDPAEASKRRQAAMQAAKDLYDAILPIVVARRTAGALGADLISKLIHAEAEGRHLTDHEITTFVRSLLPAAAETTTRTFGIVMTLLLQRPKLLDQIRGDRALVSKAIDEAIRFEPTATFKVRQAAVDLEIDGVAIPKGAMVSAIVASANRDEDVFERADEFEVTRPLRPSFGFGFGPHMCIGMFVAKAEIYSALNAVFDLMPGLRLDETAQPPKFTGLQLRGPEHVHVAWN